MSERDNKAFQPIVRLHKIGGLMIVIEIWERLEHLPHDVYGVIYGKDGLFLVHFLFDTTLTSKSLVD